MSVYSAIEGTLKIQGTVSGTDATAVRLDEPTHALKVYLTNPSSTTVVVGDVSPNTLVGTDGITIISGSSFTTIQGFRPEFVAASGFLQAQIVGAGVTSLNAVGGAVLITGTQNVTTQTSGQTITITGPDLSSYATTSYVNTVSGSLQDQIGAIQAGGVEPAIVGQDGITVASGSNTTTITGFRTEFVAASGSLQSQISSIVADEVEPAITGTDGITITSGTSTTNVAGFRSEFVAASGSLQSQITSNTNAIANLDTTYATDAQLTSVSGHLQTQISSIVADEIEPAIIGTDGNTVISGSSTTTVQGFRSEFVLASGSLQSQIDAVEASDVDGVNAVTGSVLVTGTQNVTTQTIGQTITITGPDLTTYATTAYVNSVADEIEPAIVSANSLIVVTSGVNTTTLTADTTPSFTSVDAGTGTFSSSLTISGVAIPIAARVDSLNSLTGAVTLAEGTNITLTPVGNTITIASSASGGSTPNAIVGAGGTTVVSGSNITTISSQIDKAIVEGTGITVLSGANTVTISTNDSEIDHGSLGGLSDDDHTIYIKADGTRAFTGSQSFGGFDVANINTVSGNTGTFAVGVSGPDVSGNTGTFAVSVTTGDVAGNTGTFALSVSAPTANVGTLVATTVSGSNEGIFGNPGTEGGGVNINGTVYDSVLKANDIGGIKEALFQVHRHSTTLEPIILSSRSNSNTTSHGSVVENQSISSLVGAGWTGSHYDVGARVDFRVDKGTVSSSSLPTKIEFRTNANGAAAITPALAMTIRADKTVAAESLVMAPTISGATGTFSTSLTISGIPVPLTGASVAGSNTEVQFNNNGAFAGDPTFTFNAGSSTISGSALQIGGTTRADTGNFKHLAGMVEPITFAWASSVTGTLVLEEKALYPYTILEVTGSTTTGTVSGTLVINNTQITGLANQTWSITQSTKIATAANTVAVGDRIRMLVSGTSNGTGAGFTIATVRT